MVIYHISDLHIRKENYINLLNSFFVLVKAAQSDDDPILVIAGDVFDTRSYLTSDDINLFTQLVQLLNKARIRTVIIPGTHDINTRAMHSRNNIALVLKEVDCVIMGDGILDYGDVEIWCEPPYGNCQKTRVMLWHGDVSGACRYNGDCVEGKSLTDFSKCDVVMLGGIHKHQFLTPTIAYSGSFVQRDSDEGLTHGYIRWTLSPTKGEFIAIPQKTVYLTLMAQNNFCLPLPDVTPSYIAIHHEQCTEKWLSDYMKHIRKNYNMSVSFIQDIDKRFKRSKEVTDMIEEDGKQVSSSVLIAKILSQLGAPAHIITDVADMHNAYMKHANVSRVVSWHLEYLAWSNVYCYGEGNYINFATMQDLVSITGHNKIGKSAIIDILINVVFNDYVRGGIIDVLNKSSKRGLMSATFSVDEVRYVITKVVTGKRTIKTMLSQDDQNLDLTTKEIYSYLKDTVGLGTMQEFISMVTALQHRQFLVDMKTEDQGKLISKRLGLDVFSHVETHVIADRKIVAASIKSSTTVLKKLQSLDTLTKKLASVVTQISEKETRVLVLKKEISVYKRYTTELSTCNTAAPDEGEVDKIKSKLVDLGVPKAKMESVVVNKEIRTLEKEKHIISGAVHIFGKGGDASPEQIAEFKKVGLSKLLGLIRSKEARVLDIYDLKFALDCQLCVANSAKLEGRISESRKLMAETARLKDVVKFGAYVRVRTINVRLSELEAEKITIAAVQEFHQLTRKLAKLEANAVSAARAIVLRSELKNMDQRSQYEEYENLSIELVDLRMRRRALEVRTLRATELTAELNNGLVKREVLDFYLKCIDRKTGIPSLLMKSACGMLSQKCCEILGDVANFGVEFVYEKHLKIYTYDYSNEKRNKIPAVMGSGYQKFVLDLVMRIVFSELSRSSNPRLLFIDEGFGSLDSTNFINLCKCLSQLKSRFRSLILISHIDEIQTYITDFIRVKKDERLLSHVQFGGRIL